MSFSQSPDDKDILFFNKDWKPVKNSYEATYFRYVSNVGDSQWIYFIQDFYFDGKLQMTGMCDCSDAKTPRSELVDCEKQGKQIGVYKYYYQSGQIETIRNFKDGYEHGWHYHYYINGQPNKKVLYIQNKMEGLDSTWYGTGDLARVIPYKNGIRHGQFQSWYASGQKYVTEDSKNGKVDGWYRKWNKAGQMIEETQMLGRKVVGQFTTWYANGQKKFEHPATPDSIVVKWSDWDSTGTLMMVRFKKGDILIRRDSWYRNGEIKKKESFPGITLWERPNLLDEWDSTGQKIQELTANTYTSWYPNGTIKIKGPMIEHKHQGTWKEFYENGNIKSIKEFENGECTGMVRLFQSDGSFLKELDCSEHDYDD